MKMNSSILSISFVLAFVFCLQALASTAEPCKQNEKNCYICGENCIARIDSSGKMTIKGNGAMNDYNRSTNMIPWINQMENIKSLEIQEGITKVGSYICDRCTQLKNVFIPNSATSIGDWPFSISKLENITIPPNITSIGYGFLSDISTLKTITFEGNIPTIQNGMLWNLTPGNVVIYYNQNNQSAEKLEEIMTRANSNGTPKTGYTLQEYIKDNEGNKNLLDDNGRIFKTIDINGNLLKTYAYDEQGRLIKALNAEGTTIYSYIYNPDGSVLTYDSNGKLIGIQGKRILTVDEASALVKNNKNTFSIRYR